ncbi:HK97 gp10 family phage protein [Novosphingobium sp. AP12]|uniref:HK97 gp10 family phage protein n=1 Tax=Novosphingobium sp. AP12 TaxID=1144305 RepID=UPI0002720AEF|nr:HK97 gp10 family phage protein [Novosphingobium sp. AP12]EJL25604.1 Bacteriophage hypothetical protein (DUF646) [Novosphingobium sp. AP12]
MTVTIRGRSDVSKYIASLPDQLARRVLRGAARTGAAVVATEAKERSISEEVSESIHVTTKIEEGRIIGRVIVKGPGAYIAPWLEYGTEAHFISVDDSQRQGLSVRKVNERTKEGSLVIGGKFVGATVLHPGARPNPFLRVSLDFKEAEAVRAMQQYINTRISRGKIIGQDKADGE